ncbi:MAG TPA: hypothetical protein PLI09_14135 [Candidatus Hydrogenedentes bacterium]|nr:hypothetical protein [Candidatus Hydrogenedentota bacterium]
MADDAPENKPIVPINTAIDELHVETSGALRQFSEKCAAIKDLLNQLEAGVDSNKEAHWTMNEIQGMQQELSQRQDRMTGLERTLQELREEVASLLQKQIVLQQEKESLVSELAQAREMHKELNERDNRIAGLQSELAEAKQEMDRISRTAHDTTSLRQQLDQAIYARDAAHEEMQRLTKELELVRSASPVPKPIDLTSVSAFDEQGRKRRMGDILVEAGILTSEQLVELLKEQVVNPTRRLGKMVVDRGYTSESVIARILAAQLRLPFAELREGEVDPVIPPLINRSMANLRRCVPIRREGERIVLAMTNPLDLIAIEDAERALQCPVEVVVATSSSIDFTIARYGSRA